MSKIIIFTDESLCNVKMDELIYNSNLPQQVSSAITTIYKHATEEKWWFYREHCENANYVDGGVTLNTNTINQWLIDGVCTELDLTKQELIDQGYLPEEY